MFTKMIAIIVATAISLSYVANAQVSINGDGTSNCDAYGGLYQWGEMMQYDTTEGTHGICHTGWHLPTDAE